MIVIDAREWDAPRPFEETMEALCRLKPGEKVRLIIGREPLPLYRILDQNGYVFFTAVRDDGCFEIDICGPGDGAADAGGPDTVAG
jgi:uncharacterized protein (DUF2249 family)